MLQIQEMNSEELSVAIAERDRPLVIDFSADCEQLQQNAQLLMPSSLNSDVWLVQGVAHAGS